MKVELFVLISEAIGIYFLVLWAHALRTRTGLAHFYALIGSLTAVMSWVTDAGVKVNLPHVTLMVGSTVFYTALLLSVFVIYVFDGPRETRVAISIVAGVSILVPVIAFILHLQIGLSDAPPLGHVPVPSLRINSASVFATVADLVFLAIAWEFLGKPRLRMPLWLRSFLTLLGVMWLDVLLFSTGAFLGTPPYREILTGTLVSRFVISAFAFPFLYLYLTNQNQKCGQVIARRPVLSILREVTEVRQELGLAHEEIRQRKEAEREKECLIEALQRALKEVRTLRGILPTCAYCKDIRDEAGDWHALEEYIQNNSDAKFSHGICPECRTAHFPHVREPQAARPPRLRITPA
jgi:uncharacterized PurR-regulated membrane protein YhhQ (DUF165 family)